MAETQKITASVQTSNILCVDSRGNQVTVGGDAPRATDYLLMAVAGYSGSVLRAVLGKEGFTATKIEIPSKV